MPLSGKVQAAALFVIFLVALVFYCLTLPSSLRSSLCFSVSRGRRGVLPLSFGGPDEVEAASARYALAFASSVGVPISITFILLMSAVPTVQNAITRMATLEGHDLSPAATGFGLGVAFTTMVLCVSLCVGLTVWWASKR